jgi:pilus assembly protein FimV
VTALGDFTLRKWLLGAFLLLAPWAVHAAGLGKLTVLSSLGQPFHAEIDLVSVQKEELASLSVRLASLEAYKKADLQFTPVVAGLRLSIDQRPDGQPYIKVTSEQRVNDFVVDILVELTWAAGRLAREYRALLDPPGLEPAPVVAAQPPPVPAPAPVVVPPPVARPPVVMTARSYGPIERGETLSKIARAIQPEGVSLEQTLVGLFRSNPDAFIRNNMNLMRTGRILRVPDREQIAAIPRQEAVKEYRAQVADWQAYRRRLADAAGVAPDDRTAERGRITARIDDKTGPEVKDVVRLSKGELPGAVGVAPDARLAADRIRSLEEDLVARERALNEANERITQLEKTIKDMQHLLEIKGVAPVAVAKPEVAPPAPQPAEKPAVAEAPKPKPKPKPVVKPAPPPEPTLMDTVMANLPLIAAGGGAIVLGGLGFWYVRRRRARTEEAEEEAKWASTIGAAPAAEPVISAAPAVAATGATAITAAAVAGDVDPLDEAGVYLSHGRDEQAEAILKEALEKQPQREEIHMKLLEIYAGRKDRNTFARYAGDFQKLTRGLGPNWVKVAAMGFALDRENPLYAAGKNAATAAPVAAETPAAGLDFDLDLTAPAAATADIALDAGTGQAAPGEPEPARPAGPTMLDIPLEVPGGEAPAADKTTARAAAPATDTSGLDFNIELPKLDVPEEKPEPAADSERTRDAGLDFKLDLGDVSLSLDDKGEAAGTAGDVKDPHWYDVQAKFDLAKAYQEMGDKAGAKEILQEVLKEGDAEQQSEAKALLSSLS